MCVWSRYYAFLCIANDIAELILLTLFFPQPLCSVVGTEAHPHRRKTGRRLSDQHSIAPAPVSRYLQVITLLISGCDITLSSSSNMNNLLCSITDDLTAAITPSLKWQRMQHSDYLFYKEIPLQNGLLLTIL